jgi:hypothetical protein
MSARAVTKEQVKVALDVLFAVAVAIKQVGSVPSGELYARLMTHLDLMTFNRVIDTLKDAGLVIEDNHRLTWVPLND